MSVWVPRKRLSKNTHIFRILGILFLLWPLLSVQTQVKSHAAKAGGDQLTEQERWVLSQVEHGEEADLSKRFGADQQQCRLSAGFLKKLVTGGFKNSSISWHGVQIANASIDGPITVDYAEIDQQICLSHCIFKDPVSFQKSHFKKDLSFRGSRFLGSANFKATKFDGDVICEQTIFERESLWRDAKINEHFRGEGAEFRNEKGPADFYAMSVGANAYFNSAKFHGPANFGLAQIGRELYANNAEFFHDRETAYFNSLKVNLNAIFKGAKFHGPVNFVVAQIGFQFGGNGAEFLNPEEPADFRGMKVGNTLFLRGAKFHGPVLFEFAEIAGNFRATKAEFHNEGQKVSFYKMKVALQTFFDEARIHCNVDMSYGNFYDLEIDGRSKDGKEGSEKNIYIPKLNLKGTLVQRDLKICNAKIDDLDASHMEVKGPASFRSVDLTTLADFRDSVFQSMDFERVTWPEIDKKKNSRQVYLGNLTYTGISIDKPNNIDYQPKDFETIKGFVEASPFNSQSYMQMETFFKSIGRESWAKEVFIRMHDRELAEKMSWWDPRRWLEWFFWGQIAGYGRAPFRVFFVSMALIILGAFTFNPEYLTANKMPAKARYFEAMMLRLFLSLDRFLPIELGLAIHWDSKGRRFIVWFYFYLQQILGWILIPIALASIYSQLK
ncbi:MAG: pentapeptide repeat-containing protein [Desulfobaccales bacterium]